MSWFVAWHNLLPSVLFNNVYNQTWLPKPCIGFGVSEVDLRTLVLFIFDCYHDYHEINTGLVMLSLLFLFTGVLNLNVKQTNK